jgi:hypothetical protein
VKDIDEMTIDEILEEIPKEINYLGNRYHFCISFFSDSRVFSYYQQNNGIFKKYHQVGDSLIDVLRQSLHFERFHRKEYENSPFMKAAQEVKDYLLRDEE